MRQSLRVGRVGGIPIGVNWSVFVILVLIADVVAGTILPRADEGRPVGVYWVVAIPTALVFLGSLLAHEVAHAMVARRRGVGVRSITLWMLGGVAQLDGEPPNARADLAIASAGPLTSLAAGAVFLLAAAGGRSVGVPAMVVAALAWAGGMNVLLAGFNLLPGAPLDGGRILRALLWMRYGDRVRAERAATGSGQVVGAVLVGVGLAQLLALGQPAGLWLSLIGWFLVWAAGMEAKSRVVREATTGLRVAEVMTREPDCAPAWSRIGDFITAVALCSRQSVFPVIGFDGEPQGIVTLDRLSRIPPARTEQRVDSVALPLPPAYTAGPDDPASSLVDRRPLAGLLVAVVVAHGRVVGMVTTDDVARLVRKSMLRGRAAPSPTA